jgi:hypothetical protein
MDTFSERDWERQARRNEFAVRLGAALSEIQGYPPLDITTLKVGSEFVVTTFGELSCLS